MEVFGENRLYLSCVVFVDSAARLLGWKIDQYGCTRQLVLTRMVFISSYMRYIPINLVLQIPLTSAFIHDHRHPGRLCPLSRVLSRP